MTDLRQQISAALKDFETYPLPEAATRLFAMLGYKSDRTLPIASVADFCREWDQDHILTPREREALDQLTSLHFLFQLTDTELTMQRDLLDNGTALDGTRIHSYLFFAAELPSGLYTRTFLSSIARAINKPLAMPALVLIRHGDSLSLTIIHRRLNKRQADRDVLEKATLIKDVRFSDPIRAHLEILNDFGFTNLDEFSPIHNFVQGGTLFPTLTYSPPGIPEYGTVMKICDSRSGRSNAAYAADRYARTVKMRIPGMAGNSRS